MRGKKRVGSTNHEEDDNQKKRHGNISISI